MTDPKDPDGFSEETFARQMAMKLEDWLTYSHTLTDDNLREDLSDIPEVGAVLAVLTPPDRESTVVLFFEYIPDLYDHPVNTVERVTGIPKNKTLLNFYAQYEHNIAKMPVILNRSGFYISCIAIDLLGLSEFPKELIMHNVEVLRNIASENINKKVNPSDVNRSKILDYPI